MRVRHSFLSLDLPDGYERMEDARGASYRFVRGDAGELEVRIDAVDATACDPRARLEGLVELFLMRELSLSQRAMVSREPSWEDDGRILSVTFSVYHPTTTRRATTRFATTRTPIRPTPDAGTTGSVFPFVRLGLRASIEEVDELEDCIAEATIAPHVGLETVLRRGGKIADAVDKLFPYLISDAVIAQRDGSRRQAGCAPEGASGLRPLAPGLWLGLAQDHGEGVRILFPADVVAEGLAWDTCEERARRNLLACVGTRELPVARIEAPAPPMLLRSLAPWRQPHLDIADIPRIALFVVGESWLAASCLAVPELRAGAAAQLGAGRLIAIAPHRDRLFVFADRGERESAALVEAIQAIEGDAEKPFPAALFSLDEGGPRAIV